GEEVHTARDYTNTSSIRDQEVPIMSIMSLALSPLLAATADGVSPLVVTLIYVAIVAVLIVVPYLVGDRVARAVRLKPMRWRVALIVFSLLAGSVIVALALVPQLRFLNGPQLKYGVDLNGGVILVY